MSVSMPIPPQSTFALPCACSALLDWAVGVSAFLVAAAGLTLVCMARHAATCVFNRAHPPPLTTILCHFSLLLNPLETLFRLATGASPKPQTLKGVGEVR